MFKKIIKKSVRGLTFSFDGINTKFKIGDTYRYIIDAKNNKIYIVSAKDGLKVSKKKSGNTIKSLIDLRAKQVVDTIKDADYLEVICKKNVIVVDAYQVQSTDTNVQENNVISLVSNGNLISRYIIKRNLLKKVSGDDIVCSYTNYDFFESESVSSISNSVNDIVKVVSLFSGAGMLDKAIITPTPSSKKKFEIIYAIDYDKGAVETYKKNIGDHIIHGDIKELDLNTLPEADALVAGLSCKPFSNENRTKRLEDHEDSLLVLKVIDTLHLRRYPVFALENVPEILSANNSYYFQILKECLPEYDITAELLTDYEYGGYTTRKRAAIFGTRKDIVKHKVNFAAAHKKQGKTVGDALALVDETWENYNDITWSKGETLERIKSVPMGGNWKDIPDRLKTARMLGAGTHSNSYRRLAFKEPSCTLVNYRKPVIIHPTEDRIISVAEASALSGFGKDFVFCGTLSENQMAVGNGVPMALGQAIRNILEDIFINNDIASSASLTISHIMTNTVKNDITPIMSKNGQLAFF